MSILDGLNPEQLAAVKHDTGPQLVIAGAGTGKTQVITRRIAYLIAQGKAKPNQILALTFTEKAAREMQERLYELIGWDSFQVPVMTFHAFGAELLARFGSHIGRSVRGGLLNETQKTLLMLQHIEQISLKYYGPQVDDYEFLEGIIRYIGQLQNAGISAEAYTKYSGTLKYNPEHLHISEIAEQVDLAALYELYEKLKLDSGSYDFSDQLYLPLEILRARPNLAERLAAEYLYVLVDEYQDTNAVQDALLRTFIGQNGNIFAVGDDDQAIYSFRGAEINNILAFAEHYALKAPAVLVRNYRSGQSVLDASYRLIQHNNPYRLEEKLGINKRLIALHDDSKVSFVPYATSSDEQEGVLIAIEQRVAAGEDPQGIAVLAATHAPLKALAKAMARRGVPYAISTTVSIFEQPELLGLWYLLKWIMLQANEEVIGHVIMGPFIGWSAEDYRKTLDTSRERMVTVEEALRSLDSELAVSLIDRLDEWRSWAQAVPVSQLAFRLIFETGLAQQWQKQAELSQRMIQVFEDLHRLLDQMQDFETVAVSSNLGAYFEAFPKPPGLEISEPFGDAKGVQLLTVHAAKGLEFTTVYLIGCSQRSWSAGRAMRRQVPDELSFSKDLPPDHEFRRLMYVAITRAKQALIVSAPTVTTGGSKQLLSPFIKEIFEADLPLLQTTKSDEGQTKINQVMTKLQQYYPMRTLNTHNLLPFQSEDGWLDLSVTALGSYEYCPFEFYLQHVLQISQPMGPQLGFGSILHQVFERYYKMRMAGSKVDLTELQLLLDEGWSDRGYTSRAAADKDSNLARLTVETFFTREETVVRNIIGSEVPIRFELAEAKLRLRGKIDALFESGGGYEIRDFKTGRTKTDPEKLSKLAKDNFQLRSYAVACEQLRGHAPSAVVLDYVVTMVEGYAELSPTILKNHRGKLKQLADSIRQHDFAPSPSAMHECAAIRFYGTGERDELMESNQNSEAQ